MKFSSSSCWILLATASSSLTVVVHADITTYFAKVQEIPGQATNLAGYAVVFADSESQTLDFTGSFLNGLKSGLTRDDCVTGCAVSIFAGTSCESVQQLGSKLDGTQYSETNDMGGAMFASPLVQAPMDMNGKLVVVSDNNGVKVGCGTLSPVDPSAVLRASTVGFGETPSEVTAEFVGISLGTQICFSGAATGLKPNLNEADDCQSVNGCGVQIHIGDDCSTADTQGGHFYDTSVLDVDPWLTVKYKSTDASGKAVFQDCVETGEDNYEGRAFVVHGKDGKRLSCGIIHRSDVPAPDPTAGSDPVAIEDGADADLYNVYEIPPEVAAILEAVLEQLQQSFSAMLPTLQASYEQMPYLQSAVESLQASLGNSSLADNGSGPYSALEGLIASLDGVSDALEVPIACLQRKLDNWQAGLESIQPQMEQLKGIHGILRLFSRILNIVSHILSISFSIGTVLLIGSFRTLFGTCNK